MERIITVFFLVISSMSYTQSSLPEPRFRSPVDFPVRLSGTFGELRSGHFHSGIDIKTYEQTGKVVKMIADGYISRIKISSGGYGRALYVTHNNGYTSVYGHLLKFNRTIDKYVRKIQKREQSYEIDVTVPKYRLFYHKGNIIAYTGNSGYSMGPHLHFEIRETDTQKPVNPLYFGFDVEDDIPPTLYGLKIYENTNGFYPRERHFDVKERNGRYSLEGVNDTINISGDVSFGIRAIDKLNDAPNPNGVYHIRLLRSDSVVWSWKADRFSFYETRYINSLIDYREFKKSKSRFVRTKIDPFNALSMYEKADKSGQYKVRKDSVTHFEFQVSDYAGNTSALPFFVRRDSLELPTPVGLYGDSALLSPEKSHELDLKGLALHFPREAFYGKTLFYVHKIAPDSTYPFPVYTIGDEGLPVHRYFTLSIDMDTISAKLRNKSVWGRYDEEDGFSWIDTSVENGKLKGMAREFGVYSLKVDTVPPKVNFIDLVDNQVLKSLPEEVNIEVRDSLTTIDEYDVFLNDKWVIAEYDAKNDRLIYRFDEEPRKGRNVLKVKVIDKAGNRREREIQFHYSH